MGSSFLEFGRDTGGYREKEACWLFISNREILIFRVRGGLWGVYGEE